jgi:spermidine/putrescine-binding protein
MPRRARLAAAVAVVALAGVTGCSRDPAPAPSYLVDLSGRTVEVAGPWSGTEQENFKAVLDEFSRRTHAKVKYTSGGNDLAVMLNSRLAGGKPPDVAFIPQPGVVTEFARRGVLKPISHEAAEAVQQNYSDPWQQLGRIDGTLYGIYFKVANKSVFWYRTDKFEEAGVEPPSTWEELKLTDRRRRWRRLGPDGLVRECVPAGRRRRQLRPAGPAPTAVDRSVGRRGAAAARGLLADSEVCPRWTIGCRAGHLHPVDRGRLRGETTLGHAL